MSSAIDRETRRQLLLARIAGERGELLDDVDQLRAAAAPSALLRSTFGIGGGRGGRRGAGGPGNAGRAGGAGGVGGADGTGGPGGAGAGGAGAGGLGGTGAGGAGAGGAGVGGAGGAARAAADAMRAAASAPSRLLNAIADRAAREGWLATGMYWLRRYRLASAILGTVTGALSPLLGGRRRRMERDDWGYPRGLAPKRRVVTPARLGVVGGLVAAGIAGFYLWQQVRRVTGIPGRNGRDPY